MIVDEGVQEWIVMGSELHSNILVLALLHAHWDTIRGQGSFR
jgi:hypothetical protein